MRFGACRRLKSTSRKKEVYSHLKLDYIPSRMQRLFYFYFEFPLKEFFVLLKKSRLERRNGIGAGVPQGTKLGPILFLAMVNELIPVNND